MRWVGSFSLRTGQTACKDCRIGTYASSGTATGQSTDVSDVLTCCKDAVCSQGESIVHHERYQTAHFDDAVADLYKVCSRKVFRNRAGHQFVSLSDVSK